MVKSNASVEELLAFTRRRLKDFDAFAFGVFGSQIWKVLQRSRNDRRLSGAQEVMKDVLRASQPESITGDLAAKEDRAAL
jgi:hypothetical protein